MKHIIIAILAVLSVLPREQFLSTAIGCPRRYLRRINGKCYYFSVKKLNWFGALNNCLRKGLTLADLSNPQDFYGAIDFLNSKGNTEDFWFGANDLQTEGRFQYISNGRLVRYYSNYSIVEPAEHSTCDDCLEVRIRTNMTVVADDNCLERQYFICSERYCDDIVAKKPRHHSHEHLHHFHHDIGESNEDTEQEIITPSPAEGTDQDSDKNESEEATLTHDEGNGENKPEDTATDTATAVEDTNLGANATEGSPPPVGGEVTEAAVDDKEDTKDTEGKPTPADGKPEDKKPDDGAPADGGATTDAPATDAALTDAAPTDAAPADAAPTDAAPTEATEAPAE